MEQRDELEIETRLRAALQARSELVTHSTLRPGIPPNEHTAGARSRRESWWSWRRMWVPVTVAAALAGGVFVGAQLPSDSDKGAAVSAGSGGATGGLAEGGVPKNDVPAGSPETVGTLAFTVPDGWQVTPISATAGCVTLKDHPVPAAGAGSAAGSSAGALPCGVDALYLKSDVAPTAWPLSTATGPTGWWPTAVSSASDIVCPTVPSGGGAGGGTPTAATKVKTSALLRSSTDYALAAQTTADYHEWAVTCTGGSGMTPMLWKLNAAPGATPPAQFAVATVVSVDPRYDTALLGMVGTLHQAS